MYNGLTTADKVALLDAKARGAEWVARDGTGNCLYGYSEMPKRDALSHRWLAENGAKYVQIKSTRLSFIQWADHEPLHIPTALAQIAEMEREQNPRTNQEALLERHKNIDLFSQDIVEDSWNDDHGVFYLPDGSYTSNKDEAIVRVKAWLLSPAEDGR